jgi:hypothetical protein
VEGLVKQPSELRKALCCQQQGGFSNPACLKNTCDTGGDFKKIHQVSGGTGVLPTGCLRAAGADDDAEDDNDVNMSPPDEDYDAAADIDEPRSGDDDDADSRADEEKAQDPKLIQYDAWVKVTSRTASGELKTKYEFPTVTVPLEDFWKDVSKFFYTFSQHHDLAKGCDAEYRNGAANVNRGVAFLVMDASESHAHKAHREHQAAYFSQTVTNLWVVSLRMRVEDLENIEEEEKFKLLAFFQGLSKEPVVRETHLLYSLDNENDPAKVQYIPAFVVS